MQIRCSYCQTMIPISRDEMLAALQHMDQHGLKYYDAHCPKCRRANRVEGRRIALFLPDWKRTIRDMERSASAVQEKPAQPVAAAAVKKPVSKPAVKAVPKRAAAKKPAPTKAPAAKKTVPARKKAIPSPAKTAPAKGKPEAKGPSALKGKPAPRPGNKASGRVKKK